MMNARNRRSSERRSRRSFIKRVVVGGIAVSVPTLLSRGTPVDAQQSSGIRSFDHVSLPLQNTEAMLVFYRGLGLQVNEGQQICSVHLGDQKINFHQPALWQQASFTMKAPSARPPCGDFCFVWQGSHESLTTVLDKLGAEVIAGPAPRPGGRQGGTVGGISRYVRDPDGNLVEFIIYS